MHFKFFTEVFFDVPLVFFTTASMGGKICTSQTRSSYSTQWSHSQLLPEKKKNYAIWKCNYYYLWDKQHP